MNNRPVKYVKLNTVELRLFIVVFTLLWLSGLILALLQYFKGGVFDSLNNLQTSMLKAHGAAAFMSLMILGSFVDHIKRGLAVRVNVKSGIIQIFVMLALVVTGWLLYYAAGDDIRKYSSFMHTIIGTILPFVIIAHGSLGRKLIKRFVLT